MTLESIYATCNLIAVLGWLGLLAAPLARNRLVLAARSVSVLLCVLYVVQLFTIVQPTGGNFNSLGGVKQLFTQPGNVMLGWTHYLAFDLFTGSWVAEDAGRQRIPHWMVIPVLITTFMIGPLGLLFYLVVRTVHAQLSNKV
jgi:Domain of unknown function (DUF4281)